jgi:hypothetical protein
MGAGGAHQNYIRAANWLSTIELEGARGIQNSDSPLCSYGDQNYRSGANP